MREIVAALALVSGTLGAPAQADDAAANAVYERMQASSTAADPASLLEKVYGVGATYLPRHKEAGIERREAVLRMLIGSQKHLRRTGGQIDMKFRLVDRKRIGDVYIDNGYIRSAVKPAKDAPEQVTYGKFVTVIAKQPEGHWAFVSDADSETPAANFNSAKPVAGLKYDR
jgi:ketosteroid isomerase-like protein